MLIADLDTPALVIDVDIMEATCSGRPIMRPGTTCVYGRIPRHTRSPLSREGRSTSALLALRSQNPPKPK